MVIGTPETTPEVFFPLGIKLLLADLKFSKLVRISVKSELHNFQVVTLLAKNLHC